MFIYTETQIQLYFTCLLLAIQSMSSHLAALQTQGRAVKNADEKSTGERSVVLKIMLFQ